MKHFVTSHVTIKSMNLSYQITFDFVFQLHQGDIHISGCYQPVAGKMVFNVVEARTLPRVSLLGAVSEYLFLLCGTKQYSFPDSNISIFYKTIIYLA